MIAPAEAIRWLLSLTIPQAALNRDDIEHETPGRFVRALEEMTSGYKIEPADILARTFDAAGYDEIVAVRDIEFVSLCEHHLLPFIGTAAIAYLPGARVVGLSKLGRLVDAFARRLQIQERMTVEIADALVGCLAPRGVAVLIRAKHSCFGIRGARKANAEMVTSCVRGVFREKPEARQEVLGLLRSA